MSASHAFQGGTTDAVRDYLEQIGAIPLLTPAEEVDLARRIEAGVLAQEALARMIQATGERADELRLLARDGDLAYRRFVRANLRLVVSVAKRYAGRGLPLLDLIQEGNIGLDRAVKRFDYRRGYKFSTYATWWVRQCITRGIADSSRLVRVPLHAGEKIRALRHAAGELESQSGRKPSVLQLSELTGYPQEEIRRLLMVDREPVSLHSLIGDDDSELGDVIVDGDIGSVAELATASIRSDVLQKKLTTLPHREAEILRMHYGLRSDTPMTLDQIGMTLGVSRERVRQLEVKALGKLRCPELHSLLSE